MPDGSERAWIRWGLIAAAACVGYFYLLDRIFFSSTHFAPIFRLLLTVYDRKTAWFILFACILAAFWRSPQPMVKGVDFLSSHPLGVGFVCTLLLATGAVGIYHAHPFSMDEYAAVFQAKTFAAGNVVARLPVSTIDWLVMPGFNGAFLYSSHVTGQTIEGYWPGFALLLAPFEFLGIPWGCNAALSGVAIYLAYKITLEISGDPRAAGWAMLFTLASGGFLANGMSYYSMQAHMTANLLFSFLLLHATSKRALLAGLTGSLALILHNPLPHALFALPWLLRMLTQKGERRLLPFLMLGYAPGLIIGVGWLLLRLSILPVAHDAAGVSGVGSGVFVWPDAAVFDMRAAAVVKLWVWAAPCLLLFAIRGGWHHRENRYVRLLTESAVLTFFGYCFVKLDQGHGWGYRYFYSAWGTLPILAGFALSDKACSSDETGSHNTSGRSDETRSHRLSSFAGAASVLGLLVVVPLQMSQIHDVIGRQLAQIPAPRRPGNNIYFIRPGRGFYVADMIQIDPELKSQDLLLSSRGTPLDSALIRQNWPRAFKVMSSDLIEQWYVAPAQADPEAPGTVTAAQPAHRQWTLAFDPKAAP